MCIRENKTKGERKRGKKMTSAQQRAWNYIRKQRVFRVGDVMMVVGIGKENLKSFLFALKKFEYVRAENGSRTFEDKTFTLILDSGVYAPTVTNHKLFDKNIGG